MDKRDILARSLGRIAWGYLLLYVDLNLMSLNLLPDWGGWLLMALAMPVLSGAAPTASLLTAPARLLTGWHLFTWLDIWLPTGGLWGLLEGVSLLMTALSLWFHFQLLTDLAALAGELALPFRDRLLRLRVINVLVPTFLALPLPAGGTPGAVLRLCSMLLMLGSLLYTTVTLFRLRKAATDRPETDCNPPQALV